MSKVFSFNDTKGIVFGSNGGIGKALCDLLKKRYPSIELIEIKGRDTDNLSESFLEKLSTKHKDLNFIINTIGQLNSLDKAPERSLRSLNLENLLDTFKVNALYSALIAKHFQRNFSNQKISLFSVLSAMVGSINDNKLGGWYGYRSSKAALNMLLKNISIEYSRINPKTIVNALHPGTTLTNFSKDYISNLKHDVLSPTQTAENLISFWEKLELKNSGEFFHCNGKMLEW